MNYDFQSYKTHAEIRGKKISAAFSKLFLLLRQKFLFCQLKHLFFFFTSAGLTRGIHLKNISGDVKYYKYHTTFENYFSLLCKY